MKISTKSTIYILTREFHRLLKLREDTNQLQLKNKYTVLLKDTVAYERPYDIYNINLDAVSSESKEIVLARDIMLKAALLKKIKVENQPAFGLQRLHLNYLICQTK